MNKNRLSFAEQDWNDILFLHWPLPKDLIVPYIPKPLELDTYNGQAWVTIVSFQATNSRFRSMPQTLTYRPFTQVNFRTYVKLNHLNERGVYFFSLNANSLIGTLGARYLYNLPFNSMTMMTNINRHPLSVRYEMKNKGKTVLTVEYKEHSEKEVSNVKLANFLTERYFILTPKKRKLIKLPISHTPWSLKEVEVHLQMNQDFDRMMPSEIMGKCVTNKCLAHYSTFKRTRLHISEVVAII